MRHRNRLLATAFVLAAACSSGEPASGEAGPAPAPTPEPAPAPEAAPSPELAGEPTALAALRSNGYGFVVARVVGPSSVVERYDMEGNRRWSATLGDADEAIAVRALAATTAGERPILAAVEVGRGAARRAALLWLAIDSGEVLAARPRVALDSDGEVASIHALARHPATGWMVTGGQGHDMVVWRVEADGHTHWRHRYGGPGPDRALAIAPSGDDSWRLAGRCADAEGEAIDCLLAIEEGGRMRWNKRYGADAITRVHPDTAVPEHPEPGTGHVLAGAREGRLWVAWIDEAGAQLREQSLDLGEVHGLAVDVERRVTLAGAHRADASSEPRAWLAILDAEAKLLAERDLGPTLVDIIDVVEPPLRPSARQIYASAPSLPSGAKLCALDEALRGCD